MIDKDTLICACDKLLDSELGKNVECKVRLAIAENNMLSFLKKGVAIGLSGGADSILLLIILRKLKNEFNFNLKALHVNHMIRGESADNDEKFSKAFSEALGIEFESIKVDVPYFASQNKIGTEEAARKIRYNYFADVLSKEENLGVIATAHNSTDNLETFIFNLMRGSGIHGLCSIAPVRDNIVRPLIYVSKEEILKLLSDGNIPFVTDETNFSVEYTRNYIRHEILPKLRHLTPHPEDMANKAISNLRSDADYISSIADNFYSDNVIDSKLDASKLSGLHPAIFSRVIRIMCKEYGALTPEKIHVDKIYELVCKGGDFSIDIPGNVSFFKKGALCYIGEKEKAIQPHCFEYELTDEFNEIPALNIAIAITSEKEKDFSSNVYKFSIKAKLSSAIIVGSLSVRNKRDGDAYFYGGMTRKLKKLFSDKKIPISVREKIPVIADKKGIVWVPGFGVRDDAPEQKTNMWIAIYKRIV